jgi:hypothetical protein
MGLGEPKTHETWYFICILMINKHENISVGVYWDDIGIPGWKSARWSIDKECMVEGETEDEVRKEVSFGCFAFFCMATCTPYMSWHVADKGQKL